MNQFQADRIMVLRGIVRDCLAEIDAVITEEDRLHAGVNADEVLREISEYSGFPIDDIIAGGTRKLNVLRWRRLSCYVMIKKLKMSQTNIARTSESKLSDSCLIY